MQSVAGRDVETFDQAGAVTLDTPFTPAQIQAAAALFERLMPFVPAAPGERARYRWDRTNDFFDPEIMDLIQHPFTEQTAQRFLRAEQVEFFSTAMAITYPEPGKPFSFWEHVDVKYSADDLDAVPRRMLCSLTLWISDVTPDRAPLMHRPGSHRQIAAEMRKNPAYIDDPIRSMDELPRLPYAEAVPLLARAGQMTVCTTALIHGASVNTGTLPRKVLFINFHPKGCPVRANMQQVEARNRYLRELRKHLRPERAHILPEK